MTFLVGLAGQKRSGKSTVAGLLRSRHGFAEPLAFADALRDCVEHVDPIVDPSTGRRYGDVVADIGYERAKDRYPEVRLTLQRLGEVIRFYDPEFWLSIVQDRVVELAGAAGVVVADVRYPNEAHQIRALGGRVVEVRRPAQGGAPDPHPSEQPLPVGLVDAVLENDSTPEVLAGRVAALVGGGLS